MQSYRGASAARLGWLAATVGVAIAGQAVAQQLEEIVVTAERRELSLQATPISVLAFTGDSLELRGVKDLFDLANLAPNLEIKGSRGSGNTSPTFEIRGISGGGGATGERSVGFYVDNVFMPRSTGPVMRVLDVDRIEVLRGPQGTLFGRNSTGGAIRVFSKQPGPDPDAYLKVTAGNMGHTDVSGMVNVPLSDRLFLRAQGASLHEDGYVQRGPQKLGGSDDSVARVMIGWHPTDKLSLTFGALHTDSDSDGSPTDMTIFNMNPVCPLDPSNPYYCLQGNYADWVSDFLESSGQARLQQNDSRLVRDGYSMPDWCFLDNSNADWSDLCKQWNKSRYSQVDANITWDIGDHLSMTSTTGLSRFYSSGVSDWQLLGMEFRPSTVNSDVTYQEIQFNLQLANGKIDLVTGMNYFSEDSGSPREGLINAIGSSTFNATTGGSANGNLWGCNDTLGVPCASGVRRLRRTGDGSTHQDSTAYGIFVNSTIHLGKIVNLTTGLRESLDEKAFSNTLFASDNFIPQDGISTTVSASDDWRATDWRGTLDFQVNKDFMVYVTSSKAFRSGTFSVPAALGTTTARPYNLRPPPAGVPPETLYNSEIGVRSEWLNGRFRFNVTRYNMNYTDRQGASAVQDPSAPTGFVIQLVNQGDVALAGTEIEATLAVTDRLSLEAATGRADYAMANVCINNGPFLFPPPMDHETSFSSRYQIPARHGSFMWVFNYTKTGPMQTHPGGFTPEEDAIYKCNSAFSASFIDSRYEVPSYSIMNTTLRYTTASGKWSGTLFVNNLTDEVYANNAQAFGRGYWTQGGPGGVAGYSAAPRDAIADYRGRPREYGLMFQYNFRP